MSAEIHTAVQEIYVNHNNTDNENACDTKPKIEENEKLKALECEICNIKVTSTKIMKKHLEGRRHKIRMERNGKTFTCDICQIIANSEFQLNVHLKSSKHQAHIIKNEFEEFTSVSTDLIGLCIIIFCFICFFINLFLLFKSAM